MSGLDNGVWPLAPLENTVKFSKIERVRMATLPSDKNLQRVRDRAEQNGVGRFELSDLQVADGDHDGYWLTVGAGSTRVGRVGLRKNAPAYRLLWLMDGQVFELLQSEPETWRVFTNGLEVGEILPIGHKRVLMFRVASEWIVRVGDQEVLRYTETQTRSLGTAADVLVQCSDGTEFQAWTGMPKRQTIWKYDQPRRALPIPKKRPRPWLPLPCEGTPFSPSQEESLGLLGVALATRQAYWTTGD